MSVERVAASYVNKPWGVADPRPWASPSSDGALLGEIRYERAAKVASPFSLLLKLLFTSQPLSIQVHPDDAFARLIGLPNGKTEAWYVVDAAAGAKVALGLSRSCSPLQLRQSIEDGSIAELVVWRSAVVGDVILVPAGTIHAIGAGLVIAEIQQCSDTTFRLFDYGRKRDLHVDCAVAAARAGATASQARPIRLSSQRTLLVSNQHFMLERFALPPESIWRLEATRETWLLVLNGSATIGPVELAAGGAVCAEAGSADIHVGAASVACLVAYTGDVARNLLQRLSGPQPSDANTSEQVLMPSPLPRTNVAATRGRKGTTDEKTPAYRVHRQSLASSLRHRDLHPRSP